MPSNKPFHRVIFHLKNTSQIEVPSSSFMCFFKHRPSLKKLSKLNARLDLFHISSDFLTEDQPEASFYPGLSFPIFNIEMNYNESWLHQATELQLSPSFIENICFQHLLSNLQASHLCLHDPFDQPLAALFSYSSRRSFEKETQSLSLSETLCYLNRIICEQIESHSNLLESFYLLSFMNNGSSKDEFTKNSNLIRSTIRL